MTKKYNWASTVPLIGGMTLAARAVAGNDPSAFITYKAFAENEKPLRAYMPNVPYEVLDDGGSHTAGKDADFITALCPCAGLSMLGTGTQDKRDVANHWMFETAEHVLGTLKPRVFWGENAPAMFSPTSERAERVRVKLFELAKNHGYTVSFYFTSTHLHGIPQRRHRTFYFFWREQGKVPLLKYWAAPTPSWAEYLATVPADVTLQADDLERAQKALVSTRFAKWAAHKHGPTWPNFIRDRLRKQGRTMMTVQNYVLDDVENPNHINEMRAWYEEQGDVQALEYIDRIITKLASGGGIWDDSPSIFLPETFFNAVIGRAMESAHPVEHRSLTIRESMYLMGLPHDFELGTKSYNIICQNVPVCTASDMQRSVNAYLEGELPMLDASVVYQDNFKQTHETRRELANSPLLTF